MPGCKLEGEIVGGVTAKRGGWRKQGPRMRGERGRALGLELNEINPKAVSSQGQGGLVQGR